MKRTRICGAILLAGAMLAAPRPASASATKLAVSVPGTVTSLLGAAGASSPLGPGGTPSPLGTGGATSLLGAGASGVSNAASALVLGGLGTWVLGGATYVLRETGHIVAHTTSPRLTSPWFSGAYWRVAGIAALLTLPFLFAAAVQALLASDIALLLRAALGYLPLAMLAVAVAAPVAMLLLAASDQLAAIVSSAAGHESTHFLDAAGGSIAAITGISGSPFISFFAGLLTVAVAFALWIELLVRDAAIYVVVLMLPLMFAAFVWPARRVWAVRTVELLVALIVSKFVIVAVLSLGGVALGQGATHGLVGVLAGAVLLILGALAPWALLRLLPVTEVASAAAGSLRSSARAAYPLLQRVDARASEAHDWASKTAEMKRSADDAERGQNPGIERPHARMLELGRRLRNHSDNGNGRAHAAEDLRDSAPVTSSEDAADASRIPVGTSSSATGALPAPSAARASAPPAPGPPPQSAAPDPQPPGAHGDADRDPLPHMPVATLDGQVMRWADRNQRLGPPGTTHDEGTRPADEGMPAAGEGITAADEELPDLDDLTPPPQPRDGRL